MARDSRGTKKAKAKEPNFDHTEYQQQTGFYQPQEGYYKTHLQMREARCINRSRTRREIEKAKRSRGRAWVGVIRRSYFLAVRVTAAGSGPIYRKEAHGRTGWRES